jgi:hypothetical protein
MVIECVLSLQRVRNGDERKMSKWTEYYDYDHHIYNTQSTSSFFFFISIPHPLQSQSTLYNH